MRRVSNIRKNLLQLRLLLDLINGERNINQLERELYARLRDKTPTRFIYTYLTLHTIIKDLEEMGLVVTVRNGRGRVVERTMLGDELLTALKRLNGSLLY